MRSLRRKASSQPALLSLRDSDVLEVDFEESWWSAYAEVNQRCADAVARVAGPHATVWIHDYQMMLVPSMVRSLRPDVTMGDFHHIPFPSPPQWNSLPHASEVVAGL